MTFNTHSKEKIKNNWMDTYLPPFVRIYVQMARIDRPIGIWLLFLPCVWGMILGAFENNQHPPISLLALFGLGAIVLRGAGCTYNDIIDYKLDTQVTRTKNRPLPSQRISMTQAWIFLIIQCLIGFAIFLTLHPLAAMLSLLAFILASIYPFMKRISWWPQLFLGLTFNLGILIGYAEIYHHLSLAPFILYIAAVFWTIGYDTIYAHQDYTDDTLVGIKSTARFFGDQTYKALYVCYSFTIGLLIISCFITHLHKIFLLGIMLVAVHLYQQIQKLDIHDRASCLSIFKSNQITGILILFTILLGTGSVYIP